MNYNRQVHLIVCLLLCISANTCQASIGIITALDSTFEQLLKEIEIKEHKSISGRSFYIGNIEQVPIVLVQSPMGKVNNAITAQLLLSEFSVSAVVSISPAGALSSELKVGDIVFATKVYQHDFGTWKSYGFIWGNVPVASTVTKTDYNDFPYSFTFEYLQQFEKNNKVASGTLVSGDQFIASVEKREWLEEKFKAVAVDMGGAAIAQACFSNNTPVVIVRIITDRADQNSRSTFNESVSTTYVTGTNIPELAGHLVHALYNKTHSTALAGH